MSNKKFLSISALYVISASAFAYEGVHRIFMVDSTQFLVLSGATSLLKQEPQGGANYQATNWSFKEVPGQSANEGHQFISKGLCLSLKAGSVPAMVPCASPVPDDQNLRLLQLTSDSADPNFNHYQIKRATTNLCLSGKVPADNADRKFEVAPCDAVATNQQFSLPAVRTTNSNSGNSNVGTGSVNVSSYTGSAGGCDTTARAGWTLAWSDEFEGTQVNTSNWNFTNSGGGFGNNELETYQTQNATVSNGKLIIEARKENGGYTSAKLDSSGKRTFQYGRFEICAKLPKGQGMWPAIWMMPQNGAGWPQGGELDIMETVNTDPFVQGTIHYGNDPGHPTQACKVEGVTDLGTAFHSYGIIWDTSGITWILDGKPCGNSTNPNAGGYVFNNANYPFYFILNVAIGGNWPGNNINDGALPQHMEVDWVRVYKKQ